MKRGNEKWIIVSDRKNAPRQKEFSVKKRHIFIAIDLNHLILSTKIP